MSEWTETLGETRVSRPRRDRVRGHFVLRRLFDDPLPARWRERSPSTMEPAAVRLMRDGYIVEDAPNIYMPFVAGTGDALRQAVTRNLTIVWGGFTEGFTSDDEKPFFTVTSVGTGAGSSPLAAVVVSANTDTSGLTALPGLGTKTLQLWRAEASLARLFELARDERFEDGVDSNLSVGLRVLFRNYGVDFTLVLEERLNKRDLNPSILAEVLHTLGLISDDATKEWRLATLLGFLKSSSSPIIRDAAAVGLAYLDDQRAVPHLLEAIERESSETFREDLRAVVEQLSA